MDRARIGLLRRVPLPPMGISRAAAELLLCEHARAPFSGAVLQLGRQSIEPDGASLRRLAARAGATVRVADGPLDDRAFFGALGFARVSALDVSDFEGADVIHDLNRPLPEALHGRFDAVVNGGSLEHVFHLPSALSCVFDALRVGGRAVHIAPTSNLIDHGFYSFSPTLLYDYHAANRWKIHAPYVFQARSFSDPWTVYRYAPGSFAALADRFHDLRVSGITMAGVFFVVEKTAETTRDEIPQQGQYVEAWRAAAGAAPPEPTGVALALRDLKRRLDRALPVFNPRVMPPRIGRFGGA